MTHKARRAINPERFRGQPISDLKNRWTNAAAQIKTRDGDLPLDLVLIAPIPDHAWNERN
ncbi:MAG: hypothetical protein DMF10_03725 [Verrucomicrobia bacterium]|nr:MAG: hypothetical protein DMF10_03725 [Verrucomicrobiota bacterium]